MQQPAQQQQHLTWWTETSWCQSSSVPLINVAPFAQWCFRPSFTTLMSLLYQESAHCCYCCCCCCYGYYFLIQRQSRLDSTRRSFAPFFLLVTLRPISCLMLCGRKTIFALVKSPKWRNYFRWFKREKLNGIKTKQVKIYFYDDATARTITTKDLCIIRCRKKRRREAE